MVIRWPPCEYWCCAVAHRPVLAGLAEPIGHLEWRRSVTEVQAYNLELPVPSRVTQAESRHPHADGGAREGQL